MNAKTKERLVELVELIQEYLEQGRDYDLLQMAVNSEWNEFGSAFVRFLDDLEVDINATHPEHGYSALHLAIVRQNEDVARALRECGGKDIVQ